MSQGINNDMAVSKPRRIVKNLRWWVLVLFLLGVTVNYITRNSLGILAPELKTSLGITTVFTSDPNVRGVDGHVQALHGLFDTMIVEAAA